MIFSRKDAQNFLILRHLPFERDISMIVAPNQPRPRPLETRNPKLSVHIKPKEKYFKKGLQIAMKISGQKSEKDKKKKKNADEGYDMADKKGAGIGVLGTPMLASHFSIPPINTTPPAPPPLHFWKKSCKNREKKVRKQQGEVKTKEKKS